MFRLSQKTDYGFILLSSVAKVFDPEVLDSEVARTRRAQTRRAMEDKSNRFISISTIARKNKLSSKFLSQVALELKKAGIIAAKEGVAGGYMLAKKPKEISLLTVLGVLEGGLVEGKCFEKNHECVCGAKDIWLQMKKDLEKSFGKKTIADLIK